MNQRANGAVVVITGASSGIGRATALALAREGAHLILAARRENPLHQVAAECQAHGIDAIAVPTDVTDLNAVQSLGRQAAERHGRVDVWINNAAVTAFGAFQDTPVDDIRRVVETNLFGYIYGARTALSYFLPARRGILINNSSMDGRLSQPYMSAYVASKHAIRGLGMSLRQELRLQGYQNVHVCTVMPATIDTPIFQHAANYSGRAVEAMPPVYRAERVAHTILKLMSKPRREVFVGPNARLFDLQFKIAPAFTEWLMAVLSDKLQLSTTEAAPPTSGNLFQPMLEGAGISGQWMAENKRLMPNRAVLAGLLLAPALMTWAFLRRRRRTTASATPAP
jgi:short-subunit dehydrogenase